MRAEPKEVEALLWPPSRLQDALGTLCIRSGLRRPPELRVQPAATNGRPWAHDLEGWLGFVAAGLGMELTHVRVTYSNVTSLLQGASPALIATTGDSDQRFLCLVRSGRNKAVVLKPDGQLHTIAVDRLAEWMRSGADQRFATTIDRSLLAAGVPPKRQVRARRALLFEQNAQARVAEGWLLRLPPGASLRQQLRHRRLGRPLAGFVAAHVIQVLMMLLAWWMIGRAAFQGRLDPGWLAGWALLLLSLVPVRLAAGWCRGLVSIGAGQILQRRLLFGGLCLRPDEARSRGVGQLLSQVLESESLGWLALRAGLTGASGVLELVAAMIVLGWGAGGVVHSGALLLWSLVGGLTGWLYYVRFRRWTAHRLSMTHELVERMVGHRTRLAQQKPDFWHVEEDRALSQYLSISKDKDRLLVCLRTVLTRGWLLVGTLPLVAPFVAGAHEGAQLAIGVGGVLLAYQAFFAIADALSAATGAAVALEQVKPLLGAASRPEPSEQVWLRLPRPNASVSTAPVLRANGLSFRHAGRRPLLRDCCLVVHDGDRLLLDAPSGSGKSTLAALLGGLRQPESGLLLVAGMDWSSLGPVGWRRVVAAAPQLQANHVFSGTLALNLLMARGWPPTPTDLQEADQVCRELGLGDLLDRMPAGLMQIVGDTGWRLSHGERGRLFVARALLQGAPLVLLDESLGGLDPESLRRAMSCTLRRAQSLFLVAHP